MTAAKPVVACVVGTRPEAIKMAPVVLALQQAEVACRLVVTGQHRELLFPILDFFKLKPDCDLAVMRPDQTLAGLTARLITGLDEYFRKDKPDVVLAQGDTTSVLAAALVAFYLRIPFGHVEAGLRTAQIDNPFPEEANRVLAGRLTRLHFVPTERARQNLLREQVADDAIFLTGNTVIDALHLSLQRPLRCPISLQAGSRLLLVTSHRRENFGEPLMEICRAILELVQRFPDTEVIWPVHPNPAVQKVVPVLLGGHERIHLCAPLGYEDFLGALQRSYIVLSDSGGVQEEAPALAKPVLVLREESERPEAVEAGVAKLVGTNTAEIVNTASRLLEERTAYAAMSRGVSPYGDGAASQRIVAIVRSFLGMSPDRGAMYRPWQQAA
jgi:UDP-N-acetylglucosamine 2-epimerase (non-hydrolysing)